MTTTCTAEAPAVLTLPDETAKEGVVVAQAVTSRRDLTRWIRLPYSIYSPESPWVAPLERELRRRLSRKNPFFSSGEALPLIAVDSAGQVRGRILAHVNRQHVEEHVEITGTRDVSATTQTRL